jgi:chromosome partitioning protein
MPAHVFAVMNQKGGCGKTTTSINLARALSYKGKRVLLIDFDPQGHASLGLGFKASGNTPTIYHSLIKNVPLADVIRKNIYPKLDLAPANILLSSLEQALAGVEGRELKLLKVLEPLLGNYDFVLIDCPPALGMLSVNAVMSAHYAIVPIDPSRFGLDGAIQFKETVEIISHKAGKDLQVRHLISLLDLESAFAEDFVKEIHKRLEGNLFTTSIRRSSHIQQATYVGKPVIDFSTQSLGYLDFMSLAHEVILWTRAPHIQEILKNPSGPRKIPEGLCFFHKASSATSVELVGSFNRWIPESTRLERIPDSEFWYTIVPLDSGTYEYQFIVDGKYITDQLNPEIKETPFGVKQSVISI